MMMMIIIIIIIRDDNNKKRTCTSIDIAIPADRNVIKKAAEKILNHKDLIIEIHRMWNVKAEVILVIIEGGWDHFIITQTLPEQHTGKARN